MEVTLTADQWDDPPPACPECTTREMQQQFKPVAITGSPAARANAIAEDIAGNDYHVADMQRDHREMSIPKVRYKDQSPASPSSWGSTDAMMQIAIGHGRQTRLKYGSGLDVLQHMLKTGQQKDLIAASKQRSMRVW
jgi:hypothetical protein